MSLKCLQLSAVNAIKRFLPLLPVAKKLERLSLISLSSWYDVRSPAKVELLKVVQSTCMLVDIRLAEKKSFRHKHASFFAIASVKRKRSLKHCYLVILILLS